jgi:hypothetical protein
MFKSPVIMNGQWPLVIDEVTQIMGNGQNTLKQLQIMANNDGTTICKQNTSICWVWHENVQAN